MADRTRAQVDELAREAILSMTDYAREIDAVGLVILATREGCTYSALFDEAPWNRLRHIRDEKGDVTSGIEVRGRSDEIMNTLITWGEITNVGEKLVPSIKALLAKIVRSAVRGIVNEAKTSRIPIRPEVKRAMEYLGLKPGDFE